MHKVLGKEEHNANPLGPAGDWDASQGRQGGEQTCRQRMKGPSYRRTPGADRDLGPGQGRERGGNHTKDYSYRLGKELLVDNQQEREAQSSGVGRQVGAHPGVWLLRARTSQGG